MSSSSTYGVTGMTCGHCVSAVTEELSKVPGVREVAVDLLTGGTSTVHVTSETEIEDSRIRDAVDEAGYRLVGART